MALIKYNYTLVMLIFLRILLRSFVIVAVVVVAVAGVTVVCHRRRLVRFISCQATFYRVKCFVRFTRGTIQRCRKKNYT